jgi:hypothetical protein
MAAVDEELPEREDVPENLRGKLVKYFIEAMEGKRGRSSESVKRHIQAKDGKLIRKDCYYCQDRIMPIITNWATDKKDANYLIANLDISDFRVLKDYFNPRRS